MSIGHKGLSDPLRATLEKALRDLEADWTFPVSLIIDDEVHEVENDRVFGRSWVFLGHESEIPEPGDYVVRYITNDQFIVCRDEEGQVRAHFNSCRHRGMQVCRADMGNASHFRCPYHGWTYNNKGKLVGVPAAREAYGDKFNKAEWGLRQIPQLDSYKGLIFGCLDPHAQPLEDFLGDMRFYIDLFADRSDAGLEVVGAPQRFVVSANWKIASEQFVGDAYHTVMTHRSMVDLGAAPPDAQFGIYGEHVRTANGHGLGLIGFPPGIPAPEFFGMPENIVESLKRRLSPEQVEILRSLGFVHGLVFPNLAFGNFMLNKDHKSPPQAHLTLRLWHPLGRDKLEIWSFFLVEKDAPDWYKKQSYESYIRNFGTSGSFEQDDAEVWQGIHRVFQGNMARGHQFNYQMGRNYYERDDNWPGPGEAYSTGYAEANQRGFFKTWTQMMLADVPQLDGQDNGSGPVAEASNAKIDGGLASSVAGVK